MAVAAPFASVLSKFPGKGVTPFASVLARFSVSSCIRIVVYLYAERVLQGKKTTAQKILYKYLEFGWGVFAHMGRFSGSFLRRLRCCFFATVLFV